jgi:hypothetical protein
MIFSKILICILFSLNIFAAENYIDSITLTKVKKLIEKEEEIAIAYKKYLLEKGEIPDEISTLITNSYLPKGFDTINPFGKEIKFTTSTSYSTNDSLPDNSEIKTNLFDYYYSNKYRVYTKAPISVSNSKVEIILSTKEKFIYTNNAKITTVQSDAINETAGKYYLDKNSVLHWYQEGAYKFSVDKDLIIDSSVTILDSDGNISTEFTDLMEDKNVTFAGQTILYNNTDDNVASEYLYLGSSTGIVKVNSETKDIGKTVIQFSRRAGGMIVNGDIYTWGNNAANITGIDHTAFENTYTTETGSSGITGRFPVLTGLVRVKAKIYDDNSTDDKDLSEFYDNNYFSSPLRPKFVDFFSTVYHSTCGISTTGALYCGGRKGSTYTFGTNFTHVDSSADKEMLYRSTYFDGITNKATKIFANNQIWLILSQDGDIYRWGYDFGSGFSGNGSTKYNYSSINSNLTPEKLTISDSGTSVKFSDITYLLTIGYRKMGALSTNGDIYIWGIEDNISNSKCSETWESINFNLCSPTKVTKTNSTLTSDITFESIYGGLEAFIALGSDGKYYKIHQPIKKKIQVELINDSIKNYSDYNLDDDSKLLSVDFSSKLSGSSLNINEGIVWVNEKNELKGDYFTYDNSTDQTFKDSINKIKWKKIKVIADDNGMCGIDIYNQMYCWGIQSFYRSGSGNSNYVGNTFMIPVFNTNLFDLDKDYLVAEGGNSNYLTNMTSTPWTTTDSSGPFFIKYPTYIGGFNYEFIFK